MPDYRMRAKPKTTGNGFAIVTRAAIVLRRIETDKGSDISICQLNADRGGGILAPALNSDDFIANNAIR